MDEAKAYYMRVRGGRTRREGGDYYFNNNSAKQRTCQGARGCRTPS